jgi:hypothetical protein
MNTISTITKYLVDTNVLIGFSLWKPISLNFNSIFWSKFSDALKNGEWVLLDVVANEVQYDTDLVKWCKEQKKNGLVTKIEDENRSRAVEINDQYKMIDGATGKSEVDTYLIAYAEANNIGIFSRESFRKNAGELYKIPDVCQLLNIKRTNKPKTFLRAIGFN